MQAAVELKLHCETVDWCVRMRFPGEEGGDQILRWPIVFVAFVELGTQGVLLSFLTLPLLGKWHVQSSMTVSCMELVHCPTSLYSIAKKEL